MRSCFRTKGFRTKGVALAVCLVAGLAAPRKASAGFDADGWIVDWLYYGPLSQFSGATPGADLIRGDYIADGVNVTESTMLPAVDEEVTPDFLGASLSDGFHLVITDPPIAWTAVNTADIPGNANLDTLDVTLIHGTPGTPAVVDQSMIYAVVYLDNEGDTPLDAWIQAASDDSYQVKLDDCEMYLRDIGGGFGVAGTIHNEFPVTIDPGPHRLLVKVFNGTGGMGFRLRIVDAAGGTPITDTSTPALAVSLDPDEFSLSEIEPASGISATRSLTPDKVVGTDTPIAVTLSVSKVSSSLSDDTPIAVTETLPDNMSIVDGSAEPAFTSQDGKSYTWEMTAGDAALTPITYEIALEEALSGTIAGSVAIGDASPCDLPTTGLDTIYAVKANAIFLGDIVGGGSGRGDKDPNIWAINTDTGVFMTEDEVMAANGNTQEGDGNNPSPVDDSDLVDSVFFMNAQTLAINQAGVEYTFMAGDLMDHSYNNILSNITNDVDKGPGNMRVGGVEGYATGLGIHASSGVTFDLEAIRDEHGAENVVTLSTLAGTDGCAGGNTVRLYIIYSTEEEILEDATWMHEFTGPDQVVLYQEEIPPDAMYLTFATGSMGDGIGCDHGVFAETRIFPELPVARITADPPSGGAPLTVNLSAETSTAPPGNTLVSYEWDFGDGATGSGETTSHEFTDRGVYTVTLTVTDSEGFTDSGTLDIQALFGSEDVTPWTSADVGEPVIEGGARFEGDCLVVFGGGEGTILESDEFHFVQQPVSGDVAVVAKLSDALFEPGGRVGIMLRESMDADAAFAQVAVYPSTTLRASFINRPVKGGRVSTRTVSASIFVPQLPDVWMKIERTANTFTGFFSHDGQDWIEVRSADLEGVPAQMLAGPAVTGYDRTGTGSVATATFCDIDLGGGPPPGKTFRRADSNDDGTVNITDGIYVLNFLFLGGPTPTCMEAADANDDAQVNITDGIYVLNFLFLGGPAPLPPGSDDCGADAPGSPDVGCDAYTNC